ncbi:type II secretion system major pseudopilin GspG [Paenalcaligenes sp. Me131]|uniref:type II secretion system major pseudopilin GspG n=1 Tax=Paenalcaligenes sp. Me131 TaxID=3392636 RepID=UPI003D28B8E8
MTPQHSLPRSTTAQASQRGFSLIEIMVVIVIMGIMAALVVPNLLSRPDQARVVAAKQDIAGIMQALKLYRLDNGFYPSAQQGLQALQQKPSAPPTPQNWQRYLDKVPTDPWGNAYQYLNPGVSNDVDVFSFGADGQRGGEEMNADIGSWQ